MKTLPAHLERIGTDLERAGRMLATERSRRRRRIQLLALVAATAAIATGAGLAASGVDLVGWLRSDDPSQASYFVETGERYDGPAAEMLGCEIAAGEPYPCREGAGGRRYELLTRVEPAERVSREAFHEGIDDAERRGLVTGAEAERIHADIDAAGDDFFERLELFSGIRGIGVGVGDSRGPLVPPRGVPMLVTCEPAAGAWTCRNLAGAIGVPVGAPIYSLVMTNDWVRAPESVESVEEPTVEAIWGRELTPPEVRLLWVMLEPAVGAGGSGEVGTAGETVEATTERP